MSDFQGMEELLEDFLLEAQEMLSGVDNKLVELEKAPDDRGLLNDIFRGFHTIKGGAGFLNAQHLVALCHATENLLDHLRNGELSVTPEIMDVLLDATGAVRDMFGDLASHVQPPPADATLIARVEAAAAGRLSAAAPPDAGAPGAAAGEPDWGRMLSALSPATAATPAVQSIPVAEIPPVPETPRDTGVDPKIYGRRTTDKPGTLASSGRREGDRAGPKEKDKTIRVDTVRLDQVLNLTGEIGLTKNRLNLLRGDVLAGKRDSETLQGLDEAVSHLELLVSDLQNAIMKTRMQPIGRLFQKYPRIARDLARQLGKNVELVLVGEETEIDKTMIEDLGDPLVHLVRNAVDHGVELPAERAAAAKNEVCEVRLEARQEGDHIVIIVADDGRGMNAEKLRLKAREKGLISDEECNTLDDRQSFNLIFMPGFSTCDSISDVSGRGVGMDVVRTNILKLNGTIDIRSELGKGSAFVISLPLTLAILPVLMVHLGEQPFAVPLSMVREILAISAGELREVGGKTTMVVRGEVLPVFPLARLIGRPLNAPPQYGVLMQTGEMHYILGIDSFAGREDAVIKSLDDFRPKGVAGVTTLSNGQIAMILDMKELLADGADRPGSGRPALSAAFAMSMAEAA